MSKNIHPIKIGDVELENNIFLAPMAGVTDMPYRLLCKEQGAGLLCMEMISAKAIYYNNKNTEALMKIDEREMPVSLQLFGDDADIMADMAERIEERPFSILDINMGCPVPKVVNNGEGSALMKDPKKAAGIVRKISDRIKKPVTVKIRLGFDDDSINCVEMAKMMEESGAAAIALHARTRQQYYSGQARWEYIRQVKDSVKIPVIGNGDITDSSSAEKMFCETGCDAIMVGRAAEGNPWVFSNIINGIDKKPAVTEICKMIEWHAELMKDYKGEYTGIREMRKHVAWYFQGVKGAAQVRRRACELETFEELTEFLSIINETIGRGIPYEYHA